MGGIFFFFLFRIVSGRFDTSKSMIPRLILEISPCDGFCDGVVVGAGLGYSSRLIMMIIMMYILFT